MRTKNRFFQFGVCGFLGLVLVFLSGCDRELSEICTGKYDQSITDVISRLEPLRESESPKRSVASLSGTVTGATLMTAGLSEDEREHWQAWSQSELKRVEAYLDWANLHRGDESSPAEVARRRLTDVANRLVAFHGYSHDGRVERMLDTLRAIESDRKEIQGVVCKGI